MFDWYWAILLGYVIHTMSTTVVSVFLHRGYAHKQLETTPFVDTFSRIWLWLIGFYWPMLARVFAALHRKHHASPDTIDDPHTPVIYSFSEIMFPKNDTTKGKAYYLPPAERDAIASDVPSFDDKLDKFLIRYLPYSRIPFMLLFLILFSWQGLIVGFMWIMYSRYSGRLHNYVTHKYGYRWQEPKNKGDHSKNFLPIGILFGGEELAANHHDYPNIVNLGIKWYEFDTGWYAIKILEFFNLIKINKNT